LEKSIRDIPPTDSHIIRFPEAAAGRAHVIGPCVADHSYGTIRSASPERADRSPLERFEDGIIIIRSRRSFCLRGQICQKAAKSNYENEGFYHRTILNQQNFARDDIPVALEFAIEHILKFAERQVGDAGDLALCVGWIARRWRSLLESKEPMIGKAKPRRSVLAAEPR